MKTPNPHCIIGKVTYLPAYALLAEYYGCATYVDVPLKPPKVSRRRFDDIFETPDGKTL